MENDNLSQNMVINYSKKHTQWEFRKLIKMKIRKNTALKKKRRDLLAQTIHINCLTLQFLKLDFEYAI